jgi:excisionase family DNA binding protein
MHMPPSKKDGPVTIHWSAEAQKSVAANPTMLLTAEETARELRIARRRVWDLIREGQLASVKIGKSRRISRAALAEYIAGLGGGDAA